MVTPSGPSGLEEAFSADPLGVVHSSEAPPLLDPETMEDALEAATHSDHTAEEAVGGVSQQQHANKPAHALEKPCEQSKECPLQKQSGE